MRVRLWGIVPLFLADMNPSKYTVERASVTEKFAAVQQVVKNAHKCSTLASMHSVRKQQTYIQTDSALCTTVNAAMQ